MLTRSHMKSSMCVNSSTVISKSWLPGFMLTGFISHCPSFFLVEIHNLQIAHLLFIVIRYFLPVIIRGITIIYYLYPWKFIVILTVSLLRLRNGSKRLYHTAWFDLWKVINLVDLSQVYFVAFGYFRFLIFFPYFIVFVPSSPFF